MLMNHSASKFFQTYTDIIFMNFWNDQLLLNFLKPVQYFLRLNKIVKTAARMHAVSLFWHSLQQNLINLAAATTSSSNCVINSINLRIPLGHRKRTRCPQPDRPSCHSHFPLLRPIRSLKFQICGNFDESDLSLLRSSCVQCCALSEQQTKNPVSIFYKRSTFWLDLLHNLFYWQSLQHKITVTNGIYCRDENVKNDFPPIQMRV